MYLCMWFWKMVAFGVWVLVFILVWGFGVWLFWVCWGFFSGFQTQSEDRFSLWASAFYFRNSPEVD